MRQIIAALLALALLAAPLHAQDDPPSLMERGAQMFLEGLLDEMSPAMEDVARLLEEAGPALQEFVAEMGPKLKAVLDEVEDWSVYEAPEVLPNGDIIIRRKPRAPDLPEAGPEGSPDSGEPIDL
ncbi:hypothetical protein ABMC89_00485 [Sulfitobacter sp. HNIBRBA3233]|uniref:hypothetical protein n=1 Tax=Sulfitobacter marinivivus TaxID=3158558 RepID=UPI0032DF7CCD